MFEVKQDDMYEERHIIGLTTNVCLLSVGPCSFLSVNFLSNMVKLFHTQHCLAVATSEEINYSKLSVYFSDKTCMNVVLNFPLHAKKKIKKIFINQHENKNREEEEMGNK